MEIRRGSPSARVNRTIAHLHKRKCIIWPEIRIFYHPFKQIYFCFFFFGPKRERFELNRNVNGVIGIQKLLIQKELDSWDALESRNNRRIEQAWLHRVQGQDFL
jgi:hypothetical protein